MPHHPILLRGLALGLAILTTGCAVVGVKVKETTAATERREAARLVRQNGGDSASEWLLRANQPRLAGEEKLAALLEAARLTAQARPGNPDLAVNQAATREIVEMLAAQNFSAPALPNGRPALAIAGTSARTLDPRTADELIPADAVQITKLRVRTTQDGVGVPYVARLDRKSPVLAGQPGIPPLAGFCDPVTALVRFDRPTPELVFYRTRKNDTVVSGGRPTRLAADFSAPLAYMLSKGKNRNIDIKALIRTDRNMDHAGLYQFEAYDPEKIPVVLVHGLMSRPETWVPAINELMADKQVRERYQFWLFLYPTGLPVWASAAKLRGEMDRFRQTLDPSRRNPQFSRMVLAGHSMGGLIASLQIREGGRHLWKQFTDTPPEKMNLSAQVKEHITRIVQFQPRPEVARVVFFATPHQGSELAVNPFAEFFSRLIRLPFGFLEKDRRAFQRLVRPDMRDLFVAPANSVVFLRAKSPFLQAILKLPRKSSIPTHSIIGDRGRGDTPDSSDGVVPYWSSHLPDSTSEKIVPSGHGTNENPDGIAEFRRILVNHSKPTKG
jgi:pimeloyl-ACP methyl ester carboxylesterase